MATSPIRNAIQTTRRIENAESASDSNPIVELTDEHVEIVFTDGAPFEADDLIRDHGFMISPSSARKREVRLFKKRP